MKRLEFSSPSTISRSLSQSCLRFSQALRFPRSDFIITSIFPRHIRTDWVCGARILTVDSQRDCSGVYALGKAIGSLQGGKALDDLDCKSHVLGGKVSATTPLVDRTKEDDLYDSVAAAVLSPQFRQVIANAVPSQGNGGQQGPGNSVQPSTVEIQRGLLSILGPVLGKVFLGIPGGAAGVPPGIGVQHGLWGDVWDGLSSVLFGLPTGPGMVSGTNPYNPAALPPHIEQGIFDSLTRFVSNPVFTNVITGVIADVLQTQGGTG